MIKTKQNWTKLNLLASPYLITGLFIFGLSAESHAAFVNKDSVEILNLSPSQDKTITGKIVSASDNMGIPGVNILVKGTSIVATTDLDGNFTIKVPNSNSVLVATYIGYVTQEVKVGNASTVKISLKEDVATLEEVVVVAYGTAKKETLTGAVEQVKAEVFEDLAVGNAALALQGRTPGLVVTRNSSRPGDEGINFLIRGASSINGIEPLVVIDGIPAINSSSFNDMNPNDIENISVLKGGSASVYGSRAAGGVILVTTKKGKGVIKVDMSTVSRIGTIGIRPPSSTMKEYGQLYLNAAREDIAAGKSPNYAFWVGIPNLERIAAGEEGIYTLGNNAGQAYLGNGNRFDEMFGNSFSTQHNFSVSGGGDKSSFRISAGYDQNVGGLKVTDDITDRYNFILNHTANISDRLTLNTNVSYFHTKFSGPSGGLDRDAITYDAPLFPSKNPLGQWYANFGGNIAGERNSVAEVIDGGRELDKNEQFKISAQAIYKITDQLNFTGSYAVSKQNSFNQTYVVTVPTYNWFGVKAPSQINSQSYIQESTGPDSNDGNITYKNYKGALNYSNRFGDHNISGLIAIEAEKNEIKEFSARRNGFIDNGVYDLNLGATDQAITTSGGGTAWGFFGYIGRVNYDYKSKYLLEVQGRRDGSSRFAEGAKWSNYGSISGGWVISSEDFLRDSKIVSFLKIRGGYGELGSTSGIGNFGYLSLVNFGSTIFGDSASLQATSSASSLFSQTTTWERIVNKEIGLDFRLFNNKLFGAIDLYQKENVGMLVRGIYPQALGTSAPFTNIGNLENKGWEVMLGWNDKIGDLDFSVSANMSDSRNKITKYDGAQTIVAGLNAADASRNILGKPINSFYMYETNGYFANQTEVNDYYNSLKAGGILPAKTSTNALRPGDTRVVDSNGDGTIDTNDLTYQGDATPHYVYGFNFDIKYKRFDLTAFFQGALDHKILRTGYFASPFQAAWQNQSSTWLGRTWTEDNPNAEFPRLSTLGAISGWNYTNKDFLLQNNRYLRMKSLIIGYTFPTIKIGNTDLNSLRIYFSGNDLFEFTSVKDGFDPESKASSNDSAYPFMRTWALGVKVSL
ncbi:TonB-dependent receptor [Flavobacterium sp. UMI-01]|uniref:SusC/RagA family TonB-linked outer membrane protein n=1 Tax=Flavobacterium sp. UMI-01 TaxID=1441053 RepID=UPI001C7D373A|nr:TonB-dependent receptor [Flavobacterium sp. UMI-01]GIZ09723.1 SusC/RagA family TonB-linked outer membrane protein [Flavobacterium sp. UMI-01]